jgi:hypothetical protein
MDCGECGASMVICAGGGKRAYVKYGCYGHKQSGVCENKLMIRQDRLEAQLLAALETRILTPANLDYPIKRCEQELRERLAQLERHGSIASLEALKSSGMKPKEDAIASSKPLTWVAVTSCR